MAYEKTEWEPRQGANLNRFEKENETDRSVILNNTPSAVTVRGTKFSAANMNKIEQGIFDAHEGLVMEEQARINADLDLRQELVAVNTRIDGVENLGDYVGAFNTYALLPKNTGGFPQGITVNDFATVRTDETQNGTTTRYVVPSIAPNGAITWAYDITYTTDISGKTDKVANAANGNFAGLDANGNLTNSGKKPADFATAAQGAKADSAYQKPSPGIPKDDLDDAVQTALESAVAGIYVHPANHPPSIITQNASNRFVTDTEKAAWNGEVTAAKMALSTTPARRAAIQPGTNLDTLTTPGFYIYTGGGVVNAPDGVGVFSLIVLDLGNLSFIQLCFSLEHNNLFQRYKKGVLGISPWKPVDDTTKAPLASPIFTGTPKILDANGSQNRIAVVAATSNPDETNLPVGSYICVRCGWNIGEANTASGYRVGESVNDDILKVYNGYYSTANIEARGVTLSGTWRCCGATGSFFNPAGREVQATLWRRVA